MFLFERIYALRETAHLGIGGGLTTLVFGSIGMIIAPGGIGAYAWIVSKLMGWYGVDEVTIGNALVCGLPQSIDTLE